MGWNGLDWAGFCLLSWAGCLLASLRVVPMLNSRRY